MSWKMDLSEHGLRLLLCAPEYPPYASGVGNVAREIKEEMSRQNMTIEVVAPRGGNIQIARRVSKLPGIIGLIPFWLAATVYLVKRRRSYDVVLMHQPVLPWLGLLKRVHRPVILTWHATYYGLYRGHKEFGIRFLLLYYALCSLLERRTLSRLNSVTQGISIAAVSPTVLSELRLNGLEVQVEVIPNASRFSVVEATSKLEARTRLFELYKIPLGPDDEVVLYVGRITSGKRPLELLRLFGKMKQTSDKLKLVVVGAGSLLPVVRRQANAMAGVSVMGHVPDRDLPLFYQAANLFLTMGPHEGFNLTAVEAATFGLPVVMSDIPAHRWLLRSQRVRGITITDDVKPESITDLIAKGMTGDNLPVPGTITWKDVANSYRVLIDSMLVG